MESINLTDSNGQINFHYPMNTRKTQIGLLFLLSTIIPVFFIGCTALAQIAKHGAVEYQTSGITDGSNLPIFYEKLSQRLTFPLSWTSGNFTEFGNWKIKAREKVSEHLIYNPPSVPFDPVILEKEDRGTYWAQRVVLNISADSRVLAYMLIPKGEGPFPTVLLLHDHGARFDIGKEKVIRPFKISQERMASSKEWVDKSYGGRFIGDELAKKGYACFATDMLNWGDRGGGGYEGQQAIASNLFYLGSSFAGLIAYEDMRATEFLVGHSSVDPSRIATMGHSVGAFRAWQLAALSDDIKASVSNCWMTTIKGTVIPGNNSTRGQSAYSMMHPGLYTFLDYPDVAGIGCPKPALFFNGLQDKLFPVPAVKDAYQKMHGIWTSQNANDKLVTKLWNVKHTFNTEMQLEAFSWLDKNIK